MRSVICPKCWGVFPLASEYWHRSKASETGFISTCKECTNRKRREDYEQKKLNEYALYKGEELLEVGTIKEILERVNIKETTLRYYGTATYKRRIEGKKNRAILIKLEDEDD